ncbi:MAG: alpha/beta hydrolase [Candidatus Dormibacteria bacterium]
MDAASGATQPAHGVTELDELVRVPGTSRQLRIRLYVPEGMSPVAGGILFVHGGGYVMGRIQHFDLHCGELARGAGCLVASLDYRLAPEEPYPAALDDCYAALEFLATSAGRFGCDSRRLAVSGTSAGAGLAAALTLAVRDRGGPALALQSLEAPMLDHRGTTPSSRNLAPPKAWNREANELAWQAYLGPMKEGPVSQYASPARAVDLTGLPPAYLAVSALELFLDETVDYARRLVAAAVPVELHVYPNGFHGSAWAVPDAEESRRWRQDTIAALRAAVVPLPPGSTTASRPQ